MARSSICQQTKSYKGEKMKINDMRKNLFWGKNGHIECKTIYDKKLFGQYICGCLNSRRGYLIYKPEKNNIN